MKTDGEWVYFNRDEAEFILDRSLLGDEMQVNGDGWRPVPTGARYRPVPGYEVRRRVDKCSDPIRRELGLIHEGESAHFL